MVEKFSLIADALEAMHSSIIAEINNQGKSDSERHIKILGRQNFQKAVDKLRKEDS